MQQNTQESHHFQEDKIDLIVILNSLLAKKLLIFGLTGFVTLLSAIYSYNLTSTYEATTSFTSPSDSSIQYINTMEWKINSMEEPKSFKELKKSVFTNFLTSVSSFELQKEVFINGDYLTIINSKNNSNATVDSYIPGFFDSIDLSPPSSEETEENLSLGFLTELPYSLSMKGSNAEVISKYLNELVEVANKNTITSITDIFKQKITSRIEEISLEIDLLIIKEKQIRFNEIEELNYAAKVAKNLGIKDNNFKMIGTEVSVAQNLNNVNLDSLDQYPNWYLYGEKALNERIKLLMNRTNDEPWADGLIKLDMEKRKLESLLLEDLTGINTMQLHRSSHTPASPIGPNKKQIVMVAFIGSFMMSILLALAMIVLKSDELTPPK